MVTPNPSTPSTAATLAVPAAALAIDGTPPAVGDEVEYTGKARVARVDGETVHLETTEVNGAALAAAPAEDMGDDELMRLAQEADAAG
ncbi:MAG: hypothetical protein B9S38_02470 [Verrucomicrobiia bacterium Tous-C4TDCM]|nr:MAG: hypothetical protein B9S38_02470 [Verrucomicrobiae bacterium Tous-C4TDCM]